MNWLETLLELLKYSVPLLIVFGFIYFILNNYLQENFKLRSLDLKLTNQNAITPIRIQAYERIIVYLDGGLHIINIKYNIRIGNILDSIFLNDWVNLIIKP